MKGQPYIFFPTKKPNATPTIGQLGKRFNIVHPRQLTVTEEWFYSTAESMTEEVFISTMNLLPGERLEITGVHNYYVSSTFFFSSIEYEEEFIMNEDAPLPIIVTETLPF